MLPSLTPQAQQMYGTSNLSPFGGGPTAAFNAIGNVVAEGAGRSATPPPSAPAPAPAGGGGYAPAPNYNAQALANINQGLNRLNERESMYNQDLQSKYGVQRAGLEQNKAFGEQNLTRQREQQTTERNKSLRDLGSNVRNQYTSFINQLGVTGAGDSSAAGMGKYALGRLEGQNRGDLLDNYNTNIGNINVAFEQLQKGFAQKLSQLDDWKRSQAMTIADKFRVARDQLEQQRASLGSGYVNQAQAQLAGQAANTLANIDASYQEAAGIASDDFRNASAQLQAYNQANINPSAGMNRAPMGGNSSSFPVAPIRRDDEQ